MAINISFGGANIKRPGAYSIVDTANMVPIQLGASRVLAFVGVPASGATLPADRVSYFNDPAIAAQQIGESELLDLMRVAWQHGADLIAVSPAKVTPPATAPTDAEWQAAIDLLNYEFVDGIVPVTTQQAILTKVDTHITNMSSVTNRKRRRGFYGHAAGADLTAIQAIQTAIPAERGMLASPTPYIFDNDSNKVLATGSHYLAAAYAGLWASLPPQEPITYKYVEFPGLEKIYDGTEIVQLLEAHVAPVEYVRNKGYRIVQGVTLSPSDDLTQSELSVSTLKDVMSFNLEQYFEEKYVGKAGVAGIEITIYNDLVSKIEGFLKNGWIAGYVPESVKVTKSGTAFTLDWEGQPTLPINNFLITSHFTL